MPFKAHIYIPDKLIPSNQNWEWFKLAIIGLAAISFLSGIMYYSWQFFLVFAVVLLIIIVVILIISNSLEPLNGKIEGEIEIDNQALYINGKSFSSSEYQISRMCFGDYFRRRKYNLRAFTRHGEKTEEWIISNFDITSGFEPTLIERIEAGAIEKAKTVLFDLHIIWGLFEPNMSRGFRNFIELESNSEKQLVYFFLDSKEQIGVFKSLIGLLVKSGLLNCKDGISLAQCDLYKEIQEFKREFCSEDSASK
jgi:hypothetical protein